MGFPYLAFLEHGFNPKNRRFRNFLGYDRLWLEEQGSEDSHGRALWALGTVLGQSANQGLRGAAGRLFEYSLPAVVEFRSPRACAYAILGIQEYLHSYPGDRDAQRVRSALAQRLLDMYKSVRHQDWKWFENIVAYGNARLSQAMLLAGSASGDERMLSAGLDSLDWLMETQRCPANGHFVPIGSQGFYRQGGQQARFDQQPVEAAGAVSACLEAYRVTGDLVGAGPHGRLSTGSWAITIFSSLFTILKPAVVGTACIPIAPIRIRERNPRSLS